MGVVVERWLKRVNLVVTAGLVVCLVVVLTDVSTRADRTMSDFWVSSGTPNLKAQLVDMLADCNFGVDLNMGDYDISMYTISEDTRDPLIAHSAGLIRKAIIISCVAVFLSVVNKTAFNYNRHEVAIYSLVFSKSYLVLLEIIAIVWAIIELDHSEELAASISEYIDGCAASGRNVPSHLFNAPHFIPLFVGFGVTLFVYIVNFLLLLNNSYRGVPVAVMEEWAGVRELLRGCDPQSGALQQIDMSMRMEIDGYENQPGIKHLLAQELGLLPEDLERLAIEQAIKTPPPSGSDAHARNPAAAPPPNGAAYEMEGYPPPQADARAAGTSASAFYD